MCPGARFNGALDKNTETEYGELQWFDVRVKPQWSDVEAAALNALRQAIAGNINQITCENIEFNFRSSISPATNIHASATWQFNTKSLWEMKDSGLFSFPYTVYCSMNENALSNYIQVNSSSDLNQLYLELFGFISGWLTTGRSEKDKLHTMTKTMLEEYRDNR